MATQPAKTPTDEVAARKSRLQESCDMPDRWLRLKRVLYSTVIVLLALYFRSPFDSNLLGTFIVTVSALVVINFMETKEVEIAGLVTLTFFRRTEDDTESEE